MQAPALVPRMTAPSPARLLQSLLHMVCALTMTYDQELILNPLCPPDLSALPSSAPSLLTAPPASSSGFIAVSLAFTSIFVLLFSLISLRSKLGEKASAALDKPSVNRLVAWLGFFGFLIGEYAELLVFSRTLSYHVAAMCRFHFVPGDEDVVW